MDLDKAFVQAFLKSTDEGRKLIFSKGVMSEHLLGEGRLLFEYIQTHQKEYDSVPSPEILEGKLGFVLDEPDGSLEFFSDEILNRKLFFDLQTGVHEILKLLEASDPIQAHRVMGTVHAKAYKDRLVRTGVSTLEPAFKSALEYYRRIKSGARGIQTPWASMNSLTLGFWPEDLVLFVARLGIGKTWCLILLALTAYMTGSKVLFATTEIARMAIGLRVLALYNKFNYRNFRQGELTIYEEDRMVKSIEDLNGKSGFWLVGGDFDLTTDSLEAAIDETEPDMVVADGAYLVKGKGASRTEIAAETFNELKRLGKRKHVVMAASTQFNRTVKSSDPKTVNMEAISLTDVAGWNSDITCALSQTEDMRRDKKMLVKPMKVREGWGPEFFVEWDLDNMSFRELGQDVVTDTGAFGIGVPTEPESSTPPPRPVIASASIRGGDNMPF